jgi:hypothetical protein
VFENRVLRIFGTRRDEVTEDWGKKICVKRSYTSPDSTAVKPRRITASHVEHDVQKRS